jgi:hypothetical protein
MGPPFYDDELRFDVSKLWQILSVPEKGKFLFLLPRRL